MLVKAIIVIMTAAALLAFPGNPTAGVLVILATVIFAFSMKQKKHS